MQRRDSLLNVFASLRWCSQDFQMLAPNEEHSLRGSFALSPSQSELQSFQIALIRRSWRTVGARPPQRGARVQNYYFPISFPVYDNMGLLI